MASDYSEGPLDDYLRDTGSVEQVALTSSSLAAELASDVSATMQSIDGVDSARGWTGVQPNVSGPSQASQLSEGISSSRPSRIPVESPEDTFAERFKYLICSSGLLEKDYVPALSGDAEGNEQKDALADVEPSVRNITRGQWVRLGASWVGKVRERWDVALAGVCLAVGLGIAFSFWTVVALVLATAGATVWWLRHTGLIQAQAETTTLRVLSPVAANSQSRAVTSLTTFISRSHSLNMTLSSCLALLETHPYNLNKHYDLRTALHRMTGNMTDHLAAATSTLLQLTDKKELGVLGEMYDIPVVGSFLHSRRQSRIGLDDTNSDQDTETDDDTRPLSGKVPPPAHVATTHLLPVLAAKYPGSSPLRALRTHSHRTQHLSLMSASDAQDRFTQLPARTPRLSKRASLDRLSSAWASIERPRHERRITEAEEEDEGDRSSSSRSSSGSASNSGRDSEHADVPLRGARSKTPTSPSSPTPGGNRIMPIPCTPILTRDTPRGSISPFRHVPSPLASRLSTASEGIKPLRTAALASPSRSARSPISLLGSPIRREFPFTPMSSAPLRAALSLDQEPNTKRRSLQNMPYYHSSDDDCSAAGMTRTQSMPFSTLQAARTATSTGFRSRSSSANLLPALDQDSRLGHRSSASIGLGLPPPRRLNRQSLSTSPYHSDSITQSFSINRVESISPLTVPALKASCLGIHLKRRRLACCLLGLKFDGGDNDHENSDRYWDDVRAALDDVISGMQEEKAALEVVFRAAQADVDATAQLASSARRSTSQSSTNIWSPVDLAFAALTDRQDYAPRTSDEAILLETIDKMGSALSQAYSELSAVRSGLQQDVDAGPSRVTEAATEQWSNIRGQLGICVREWERGREVIGRIQGADQPVKAEPVSALEGRLPDFMQAWDSTADDEEGDTSQSTSLQTDLDDHERTDSGDTFMEDKVSYLPPVGKDDIFEAISVPLSASRERLGKMSRQDRINLAKVAGEQGVSLSELLERQEETESIGNGSKEEMRMKSGMVVDELRGVIGVIRRMKEGGVSDLPNEAARFELEGEPHGSQVGGGLDRDAWSHDGPDVSLESGGQEKQSSSGFDPNAATRGENESLDNTHGSVTKDIDHDFVISTTTQIDDGTTAEQTAQGYRPGPSMVANHPFQLDLGELKRSFRFPKPDDAHAVAS
ncbi:hypothetical protein IAU60_004843 [Kwoniella sp. DSM 27419]